MHVSGVCRAAMAGCSAADSGLSARLPSEPASRAAEEQESKERHETQDTSKKKKKKREEKRRERRALIQILKHNAKAAGRARASAGMPGRHDPARHGPPRSPHHVQLCAGFFFSLLFADMCVSAFQAPVCKPGGAAPTGGIIAVAAPGTQPRGVLRGAGAVASEISAPMGPAGVLNSYESY